MGKNDGSDNALTTFLSDHFPEVSASDFYRDLFPVGRLATDRKTKGTYSGCVVRLCKQHNGELSVRRYPILDDLETLRVLSIVDAVFPDCTDLVSPVSYAGRRPMLSMAHELFSVTIDLDNVRVDGSDPVGLRDLLFQMRDNGQYPSILPTPTYIVSSGTGLHLYYLLDEPVRLWPNVCESLRIFRDAFTKRIWNQYVTSSYREVQLESVVQAFRMVGTLAKDGKQIVRAFKTGERVTVGELNAYVPEVARVPDEVLRARHTLEEARELWPDWDPEWRDKAALKKNASDRRYWHVKRDLYDWWCRRVESGEPFEGNRYYCLFVATCYAAKCPDVTYEEHEAWCYGIRPRLDLLTEHPDNRFTEEDVASALAAYGNPLSKVIRRDKIASMTSLPMPVNKRNGRDQKSHLTRARAVLDIDHPDGSWRYRGGRVKGTKVKKNPKRDAVVAYAREHPDATQREISAATGVSLTTVYKWVRWMQEQGDSGEP